MAHANGVMADRAEASALAELRRMGVPPMNDPLTAMSELAAEARQWEMILRGLVAELESVSTVTDAGVEQIRSVVVLFERSMDRAASFAATLAKLDIEERIFAVHRRISEAQGLAVSACIERILTRLGHEHPKRDRAVAAIVAEELHAATAELES